MSLQRRLCCIFNYAPHYRKSIFNEIDKTFGADFYFGDRLRHEEIKKIDYGQLRGFRKELKTRFFGRLEYASGWIRLALNPKYKSYLIYPTHLAINQWPFLLICKLLGKKVYIWMHGITSTKLSKKSFCLYKLYDKFVTKSLLYGERARDMMISRGFKPEKLAVIHNSLDYDNHVQIRKTLRPDNLYQLHFGNNDRTLIFIGRITAVKSLDVLISAMAILRDRGQSYNLVLVGDGPLRETLRQQAESLNLAKRIWFYGACYDEVENARLIYNADLCVSPGNVGLTAIHSLTFGTPVITNDDFDTQMPEVQAVSGDTTGGFFTKDSAVSLADAITAWFDREYYDREAIRNNCQGEIDLRWNPHYQINVLKQTITI